MTRKHFVAMAAAVKEQIDIANDNPTSEYAAGMKNAAVKIGQSLANIAADANPNFDLGRFYAACGIKWPVATTE